MKNIILNAKHIVIAMHENPDGDAIGSALGLFNLFKNFTKVSIFNRSKEMIKDLDFLPGFDKIKDTLPNKFDLLIVVDSASLERVGIQRPDCPIINIDHHESNCNFGDYNFVDFSRPSCAEVVFGFLEKFDFALNKPAALSLYCAIVTDTQSFSTNRVDKKTFMISGKLIEFGFDVGHILDMIIRRRSLAKTRLLAEVLKNFELCCDAKVALFFISKELQKQTATSVVDTEGVADEMLKVVTVQISILFFEMDDVIKISFRGKGEVDLNKFASYFGGGGHKNAAGLKVKDNIDNIKKKIIEKLKGELIE